MGWQTAVTLLLVVACSAYTVWTLMPAALRQRCRVGLALALGRAPPVTDAGGCGGCGACATKAAAPAAEQVVKFVKRPPGA